MSARPSRCVVDASVGVKLFVAEPDSEKARLLFDGLTADPPAELHIPDLFYIECANILWKYLTRFGRPLEDCQADLADLGKLALRVVSTADLMENALTLAAQTSLTAYDACYAVLARDLHLPLVTADQALVRVIPWAMALGELDLDTQDT